MPGLRIEIIVWTVSAIRYQRNETSAIRFLVVSKTGLNSSEFSHRISHTRWLWFAREKLIFSHGLEALPRIHAGRAKKNEFLDSEGVCCLHDIRLNAKILTNEAGGVIPIFDNSTDLSRGQKYNFGSLRTEKIEYIFSIGQFKFCACSE